jgi:hypothetical protein
VTGTTTLGADLTVATGTAAATFTGAVDGPRALTRTGTGATTFSSTVGATTGLASLTLNSAGLTTLGGAVTTTGAQTYGGALTINGAGLTTTNSAISVTGATTLGANATLAAGAGLVTLTGAVNGAKALAISGAGGATFGGAVGATTALTSLATGAGTAILNGSVTTTGTQTYGGALTLNAASTLTTANSGISVAGATTVGGNTILTTGSGGITFTGSIDDAAAGVHTLTATTTTGTATFNGNIGAGNALSKLIVAPSDVFGAGVLVDSPVVLAASTTFGGSGVFNSGINGTTAGTQSLSLAASAGGTVFNGSIGGTTSLSAVSFSPTSGGAITVAGGATTTGAQTYSDAAGLNLGGTFHIAGVGAFGATGPVTLLANTVVTTTNSAASFSAAINADTSSSARGLTVASGTGAQTYGGALGSTNALGAVALTSTNAAGVSLANASNAMASISYTGSGPLTVANSGALTVTGVNTTGAILISTQTGNLTVAGNIATTSATAGALTLEAGSSANRVASPGATDSNGDVVISSGAITVGAGGIGKIYTGSIAGSTGVTAAVGVGKSRYWSDANGNTGYSTALIAGLNAIYREQPVVTVTASATGSGRTYDASTTTATLATTGQVNGDAGSGTGTVSITGAGSSLLNAGSYTVGLTSPGAGAALGGLGYAAQAGSSSSYSIVPASVTVTGAVASNRSYNGTTAASLSNVGSLTGLVGGQTLGLSETAASFANKTVANGKTVTITGYSLSDGTGLASNYVLTSTTSTATANITPASISAVTGITASDKVYDATASATLATGSAGFTGILGSDALTVATATGAFSTKTVGNSKTVNITGLTLSGADAGNYTLASTTASTTANITPASILAVTGITASNKIYDSTTTANLTTGAAGFTGILGSDVLSVATATGAFATKTVGNGKTVGITSITLGGADAGNYTLASTTASTTANITPASISAVTGITASNKVYDTTTAATLATGSAGFTGIFGSDALSVGSATGTFATKTVGNGKAVSITGITLSGADAGNYTLASNTASTTANITPAPISVSGITATNKVYDGTTAASIDPTSVSFSGRLGSDALSFDASLAVGAFADKNVGAGKTVNITGITLGGADAGNYALAANMATTTANITPASITAVTGITASNKVYDATTAANLATGSAGFTGRFGSDALSVGSATGTFANKNAGSAKTVNITGITLAGADAGNYTLASSTASTIANITPAQVRIATAAAANKVYDGGASATVITGSTSLSGRLGSDVLTVSTASAAGTFANKNAGSGKTVTIAGFSLGGADAGNYVLTGGPVVTTADITPAPITIQGIIAADKVYDGGVSATLATGSAALFGGIGGDVLTVGSATGAFIDKNAGAGKTVNISGITLGGADAGNYILASSTATATANIVPATIQSVTGITAADKVFDGTTAASLATGGAGFTGRIGADLLSVAAATGAFTDPAAGVGKTVNITGITLGGLDAANYVLGNTTATATASITPANPAPPGLGPATGAGLTPSAAGGVAAAAQSGSRAASPIAGLTTFTGQTASLAFITPNPLAAASAQYVPPPIGTQAAAPAAAGPTDAAAPAQSSSSGETSTTASGSSCQTGSQSGGQANGAAQSCGR